MIKLSIIVPVYNVERYVEKCLLSCLRQDVPADEYEVIVVNDGTKDSSFSICERVSNAYNNIRLVSQQNAGLSMARNRGLSLAEGEYIWFVDSDDYIEEDCLSRIFGLLEKSPDILQLQYRDVFENGEFVDRVSYPLENKGYRGKELMMKYKLPVPAPFSVFKKELLDKYDLRFYKGIYYEDSEFKPRALYFAGSIVFDTKVSYNYLRRSNGSITSVFNRKNAMDLLTVMNSLYGFQKSTISDDAYAKGFYSYISTNMNSFLLGLRSLGKNDYEEIVSLLDSNRHLFECMVKSKEIKFVVEGYVFLFSTKLGLFLHRLLR